MINAENFEIRSQVHEMWAAGIEDKKPMEAEIMEALKKKGFIGTDIDIHFDILQECWRWFTYITPNVEVS